MNCYAGCVWEKNATNMYDSTILLHIASCEDHIFVHASGGHHFLRTVIIIIIIVIINVATMKIIIITIIFMNMVVTVTLLQHFLSSKHEKTTGISRCLILNFTLLIVVETKMKASLQKHYKWMIHFIMKIDDLMGLLSGYMRQVRDHCVM